MGCRSAISVNTPATEADAPTAREQFIFLYCMYVCTLIFVESKGVEFIGIVCTMYRYICLFELTDISPAGAVKFITRFEYRGRLLKPHCIYNMYLV